jgi:hypothetical protein
MSTQSPEWIATARMLRRTGFGTTGRQVDAVVRSGWPTYLDAVLDADPEADPGARDTPMPKLVMPAYPGPTADVETLRDYATKLDDQMYNLSGWWLRRMAAVRQPIHEKLTLLWHNHFATSREKVPVRRARRSKGADRLDDHLRRRRWYWSCRRWGNVVRRRQI